MCVSQLQAKNWENIKLFLLRSYDVAHLLYYLFEQDRHPEQHEASLHRPTRTTMPAISLSPEAARSK